MVQDLPRPAAAAGASTLDGVVNNGGEQSNAPTISDSVALITINNRTELVVSRSEGIMQDVGQIDPNMVIVGMTCYQLDRMVQRIIQLIAERMDQFSARMEQRFDRLEQRLDRLEQNVERMNRGSM
ncbi:hypothetical protein E4U42_000326 [Claviceps africana]|uniref:Uncharacterized protein n=1 Tax=Claviceps africana TaxID=83212 RepID=A0A8K0JAS3_9HYPO|nr:hypothetical protein E4U42_000326 [Claviceps africana]